MLYCSLIKEKNPNIFNQVNLIFPSEPQFLQKSNQHKKGEKKQNAFFKLVFKQCLLHFFSLCTHST